MKLFFQKTNQFLSGFCGWLMIHDAPAGCRYHRPLHQQAASGDGEFCIKGARGMNEVLVEAASAQKTSANDVFRAGQYDEAARMYLCWSCSLS